MNELSLFSGAGGGLLGSILLGWRCVGYVENNDYCQQVLRRRIDDGIFDEAPIFGDIRAFIDCGYADQYSGMVDVITAGFPCQPFSAAGKRRGEDDPQNLWPENMECIRRIRPRYAFLENVPGLLASGYFGRILGDLAESGFNARWRVLSAAELGAPHKRDRLWIVADTDGARRTQQRRAESTGSEYATAERGGWWQAEPDVGRVADGVANRVDRLKAIGNGQVPAVVAAAWEMLNVGEGS